jgi:hypothetical protein
MPSLIPLIGRRFGRWLVIRRVQPFWECKCDCGTVRPVRANDLLSGKTRSCGCLHKEELSKRSTVHGLNGSGLYSSWTSMLARCYTPSASGYCYYGRVGIKVCKYIRESPSHLLSIIGHRPHLMSLDRIDTRKHYSCGKCPECIANGWLLNVRWATATTQSRNRSNTISVTIDNVTKSIPEWSSASGIKPHTLYSRYYNGSVPFLKDAHC